MPLIKESKNLSLDSSNLDQKRHLSISFLSISFFIYLVVMMDIIRRRSIVLILFLVFLFFTQNYFIFSLGTMNNIICKPRERRALLSFKQHLNYSYSNRNSLSSWSGENCCGWAGVVCSSNTTTDHHVVQLQLDYFGLGGELNPSLQELKQLRHLDLSGNEFDGIRIPDFLGSLQSLRYLNLSYAGFSGMIPHQLGNLSNLRYLDLSGNFAVPSENELVEVLVVGNFQWISHLSSLKHLDLSLMKLKNASSNWFHVVNMLPSLLVLRLHGCALSGALPTSPLSHVNNFTSLQVLDLRFNSFNSTIPEWLYSLTNLQQLDLSWNRFQGTISPSIGNLTKLTLLDLSHNQLEWEIPRALGRLTLLKDLDLRRNKLKGSVPESFGNLSKLETLCLSYNSLEGNVSEGLFSTLTSLQEIELHSVVLKVSPEWIPPFQLLSMGLRNCQLGPRFPNWIQTQKHLYSVDLSSNGISGTVPTWFWNLSSQFSNLNLSHNHFNGELPKVLKCDAFGGFFLSSNQFKGPLPRLAYSVEELDLSNNSFSGPISALLCNPLNEVNELKVLDLSKNLLSSDFSQCWFYWTSLTNLRLGSNTIMGNIPSSIGSLHQLTYLHLRNNSLSGELPLSLKNCTLLVTVDIGENVLTGRLPIWFGESFPNLLILGLRRNKFHGEIPQELCNMTSLQILDLAQNNLSGSIPKCFGNLSAMATKQKLCGTISSSSSFRGTIEREFVESSSLVMKGREFEYSNTLALVTSMDLSKNSLSGEIPEELTSLIGLISLNLSENRFTGKIPEKIGNMGSLESLDLSKNEISGAIPQSISGISSLSLLNLSYNNLSGKIPLGTQLQSFNEYSFIGNQELCGLPFNNCSGEEPPQKPSDIGDKAEEDEDWFDMKWFYMSMGVGFAVGFWAFWGVMVLKRSWRIAYFRFLDDMKDKLCILF